MPTFYEILQDLRQKMREVDPQEVSSMSGGFKAWKEAGLPFEVPQVFSSVERTRYGRHIRIPEVGEKGQRQMLDYKVLIIVAGGLGSAAAYYLAAAGVG